MEKVEFTDWKNYLKLKSDKFCLITTTDIGDINTAENASKHLK